jgi:hypothetical protein
LATSASEDSIDDSDADKDYVEEKDDSSSSSCSSSSSSSEDSSDDKDDDTVTTIRAPKKGGEVRVYMNPPQEKANGDTDVDKGGQTF